MEVAKNDTCPMQIKAWQFDDGTFRCSLPKGHKDDQHVAPGLYSYQRISWFAGDRREFSGEFVACEYPQCHFPARHRGGHGI